MKTHLLDTRALAAALLFIPALCGCASLEPDAITAEVGHESHATQHEPLTDHPSNYGRNEIGLAARWQRGRFFGEVAKPIPSKAQTALLHLEKCLRSG